MDIDWKPEQIMFSCDRQGCIPQAEQRAVYKLSIGQAYASVAAAGPLTAAGVLVCGFIFTAQAGRNALIAWTVCGIGLGLLRWWYVRYQRGTARFLQAPDADARALCVLMAMGGLHFGTGYLLLAGSDASFDRMCLTVALVALSTGAAVVLCSYRPAFLAFVAPMLLSALASWSLEAVQSGDRVHFGVAIMMVMFSIGVLHLHHHAWRIARSNVQQRLSSEIRMRSQDQPRLRPHAANEDAAVSSGVAPVASSSDDPTDVASGSRLRKQLVIEWNRHRRSGSPLAMVLVEIDGFALIQSHFGTVAADACLQRVARIAQGALSRSGDFIARDGEFSFVLLLPDTGLHGATTLAERVRKDVEDWKPQTGLRDACARRTALRQPSQRAPVGTVPDALLQRSAELQARRAWVISERVITVTVGVASLIPSQKQTPQSLWRNARSALATVRRAGRNRVGHFVPEPGCGETDTAQPARLDTVRGRGAGTTGKP